ncbi:hypothetical protein PIB30_026077 [Stylosanthes scabra]|uniref:3'-5' exonuclease domain-containing protein n=1 Tax=Stylosanthes scabra TaxID=79078 RepID=A0ABU6Y7G9_9FABA|nr:hypothetical protein [Stylosanthes scabra]
MIALSSSSPPSPSSIINVAGSRDASTVSFNPETFKYTIKFDEKTTETTITDKAVIIDQWIQDINVQCSPYLSVIFGLDFERNSSKTSVAGKKPATLHLCIDDKCLILQLKHIDNFPLSLKNFLKNPNFFFVGFGVVDDINSIGKDYGLDWGVHADIKVIVMENGPFGFRLGFEECS